MKMTGGQALAQQLVRGLRGGARWADVAMALLIGSCIAGYTLVDNQGNEHVVEKYCNLLGTTMAGVVSHEDRIAVNVLQIGRAHV